MGKKTFKGRFFRAIFPFAVIKKAEKVSCFGFLRSGERKNDKNIKSTTLFFSFRELFYIFLVLNWPEKMFGKCVEGKENE